MNGGGQEETGNGMREEEKKDTKNVEDDRYDYD